MKKVTVTVQGWTDKTESIASSIKKVFERHAYNGALTVDFKDDRSRVDFFSQEKENPNQEDTSSNTWGEVPDQSTKKMMKDMLEDEEMNDLVSSLFEGLTMIMEIERSKNYPKNDGKGGDFPIKESDGPRIIGDIWDDILSGKPSYGWKKKNGIMVPDQESYFNKEMAKQKESFEKDSDTVSKILNSLNDKASFSDPEKELMSETLKEVLEDSVKVLLVKNRGNLKPVLEDIKVLLEAIKEL